ncbi:hypothetical protein [Pelagibius sp. 7325]|uniref:hypothetical protein n=1 Tax=Pelagibius sp. 7325 TaxID=3131994 RepID=UPI0030EB6674
MLRMIHGIGTDTVEIPRTHRHQLQSPKAYLNLLIEEEGFARQDEQAILSVLDPCRNAAKRGPRDGKEYRKTDDSGVEKI